MLSGFAKCCRSLLLVLMTLSVLSVPVTSQAADQASPSVISEQQAASKVQQHYGGDILSIKLIRQNERLVYKIKIVSANGTVKAVHVDAYSGQLLH